MSEEKKRTGRVLLRAFCLVIYTFLTLGIVGCRRTSPSFRFLIPAGYVGIVKIEFGIANAPELPMEAGRYLIQVPADGKIQTSTPLPTGWRDADEYYYVAAGSRQQLYMEKDPYPVGTTPPPTMVRSGNTFAGNNNSAWVSWFIGTDKQFADYRKKKHEDF